MLRKKKFLRKPKLLELIDRLPGTVYQYRQWKDGRCTFPYSTQDIENIFFATPVELAKNGQLAWDRVCPESIVLVRNTLKNSAERLEKFEITFCVRSPQNCVHWILNHAVPERLRDGSTLWHGHMENITVQYEAAEAAKRKAALLNVIFETMPDQICYMDRDSRILGVNPSYCHFQKKQAEELVGKTDKELYNEEQKLMADGTGVKLRKEHVQDDGSIVHLESVKSPLHSPSGRVIGLACILRDITQQVKAEDQAELLQVVFENLPARIYYKDRQSRFISANQGCIRRYGVTSLEELAGKSDLDFIDTNPLARQSYEIEQKLMENDEIVCKRETHVE